MHLFNLCLKLVPILNVTVLHEMSSRPYPKKEGTIVLETKMMAFGKLLEKLFHTHPTGREGPEHIEQTAVRGIYKDPSTGAQVCSWTNISLWFDLFTLKSSMTSTRI